MESEFESCLLCGYQSELAIWIDSTLVVNEKRYGVCLSCRSKVNSYDKTVLEVLNTIRERDELRDELAESKAWANRILLSNSSLSDLFVGHINLATDEATALRARVAELEAERKDAHQQVIEIRSLVKQLQPSIAELEAERDLIKRQHDFQFDNCKRAEAALAASQKRETELRSVCENAAVVFSMLVSNVPMPEDLHKSAWGALSECRTIAAAMFSRITNL